MFRLFYSLCFVVLFLGCVPQQKRISLPYDLKSSETSVFVSRNVRDKAKTLVVGKDVVQESKYKILLNGSLSIASIAAYLSDVLGLSYVASDEVGLVSCGVDAELSRDDVISLFSGILESSGYSLVIGGDIVSIKKGPASGVSDNHVVFIPVKYLDNNFSSVGGSVSVRVLGGGVLLSGKRPDVLTADSIIRLLDRNILAGLKLIFTPYSMSVCDKAKKILSGSVGFDLQVTEISDNCTVLALKSLVYEDTLMSILKSVDASSVRGFYFVPVKSDKVAKVVEVVKAFYPTLVIAEREGGIIVGGYSDYRSLMALLSQYDALEKLLHVQFYLVDIQSRDSQNLGLDITLDSDNIRVVSGVRDAVGVTAVGTFGSLKTFVNYLVQKFDGKVLSSPSFFMLDGTKSTLNFGQSIPILRSKSETQGGGLVQGVEYNNVGLSVNLVSRLRGDYVYSDVSVSNSTLLEGVGVEGNPQFSNDSVSLSLVSGVGKFAVVAGLVRGAEDRSLRHSVIPFNIFRKVENREFVLCLCVSLVSPDVDYTSMVQKLSLEN